MCVCVCVCARIRICLHACRRAGVYARVLTKCGFSSGDVVGVLWCCEAVPAMWGCGGKQGVAGCRAAGCGGLWCCEVSVCLGGVRSGVPLICRQMPCCLTTRRPAKMINVQNGVICAPPPIVSRAFQDRMQETRVRPLLKLACNIGVVHPLNIRS